MMRKIFFLLTTIILTALQGFSQKTSSFSFSQNTQTVSGWINMHGDPAAAPVTATDPLTGFTVSSIAAVNWYGGSGASSDGGGADNGTFFPAAVMKNHWFQGSAFYGLYNAATPQLIISGLKADSVYTLKMTGSLAVLIGLFNLNPIRYTVAGAINYGYIDVNGNYNTSDGAVFHNIAPAADGKIKIYVNTYDGSASGSNIASISGLQIIEAHSAAPSPVVNFTNPANNDILPEDGYIILNATATETGGSIQRVEFYADTTKLGADSTAPYSFTWLSPDPGKYVLKARAVDGQGNTSITTINVSVESLSSFWSMTGNIGANADTNFLGTVDTNRLAFRTNNIERVSILKDGSVGVGTTNTQGYKLAVKGAQQIIGIIDTPQLLIKLPAGASFKIPSLQTLYSSGASAFDLRADTINIALGAGAGATMNPTVSAYNVAIGSKALGKVTTGSWNFALGPGTLGANTSGNYNIAIGGDSAALGQNTTGNGNIALGTDALSHNTTGGSNIAIGFNVMKYNVSGIHNVALGAGGQGPLRWNRTGSFNVAIGSNALGGVTSVTSTSQNVAIGYNAAMDQQIGTNNIFLGYQVNALNAAGNNNTVIGANANVITGSNNILLGDSSKANNTTNTTIIGRGINTALNNIVVIGRGDQNIIMGGNSGFTDNGAKLQVNGTIQTKKIKVTQTGWPDYVFRKGYHLPSLDSIEQYITGHRHLPGIVSAAEVEKKGLDLGDNQAAMLKKIEELTLYMIEQNKKLEHQQQEIDELRKIIRNSAVHP